MELVKRTVRIDIQTREVTLVREEPMESAKGQRFYRPIIDAVQHSCEEIEELIKDYLDDEYEQMLKENRKNRELEAEDEEEIQNQTGQHTC